MRAPELLLPNALQYASWASDVTWAVGSSAVVLALPILIEIQRESTIMIVQRQREVEQASLAVSDCCGSALDALAGVNRGLGGFLLRRWLSAAIRLRALLPVKHSRKQLIVPVRRPAACYHTLWRIPARLLHAGLQHSSSIALTRCSLPPSLSSCFAPAGASQDVAGRALVANGQPCDVGVWSWGAGAIGFWNR